MSGRGAREIWTASLSLSLANSLSLSLPLVPVCIIVDFGRPLPRLDEGRKGRSEEQRRVGHRLTANFVRWGWASYADRAEAAAVQMRRCRQENFIVQQNEYVAAAARSPLSSLSGECLTRWCIFVLGVRRERRGQNTSNSFRCFGKQTETTLHTRREPLSPLHPTT